MLMATVRLLKNVLKNFSLKMTQSDPGVYHPIDHETPTGVLADRLSKVSIMLHIETESNSAFDHQINYLFSILESRGFDFADDNYRILWETNKSIHEMRKCLSDKINTDGILDSKFETDCRAMHVKTMVRESLVASISYHYDSK